MTLSAPASPPQPMAIFDRALLRVRKRRAAAAIAGHEFLLARVADDLVDRLASVRRGFPLALDLGAWHGPLGRRIRAAGRVGTVIAAESALELLAQCDGPRVACDEELLPFAPASLDLVVSGLALQLVNDLPGTLAQIHRALKPDGLLLAALLGGRTLTELREALIAAEVETTGGASPRVAPFADVRDLGGLLQRAGFALPVVDTDEVRVTYPGALHLMRELRGMGATNVLLDRSRRPLRRQTLMRAVEVYAERFPAPGGRVTATFEIITMTGWVPHPSQQQPLRPGSARARLADALGVEERPAGESAGRPRDGNN